MKEQVRERKPRRDRGPRLTERDLQSLKWIGEMYCVRMDQLQRLLGVQSRAELQTPGRVSDSVARHTVDRWEEAGLVGFKKILADVPGFCWLTTAGLHVAGLPFRKYEPSPSQLEHIYWCNQVRLAMVQQQPGYTWESERWLRYELDQRIKSVKLPDAIVQGPAADAVAGDGAGAGDETGRSASRRSVRREKYGRLCTRIGAILLWITSKFPRFMRLISSGVINRRRVYDRVLDA